MSAQVKPRFDSPDPPNYVERRYKAEAAVPSRVTQRFNALAGLIQIADREFQAIYNENTNIEKDVRKRVESCCWPRAWPTASPSTCVPHSPAWTTLTATRSRPRSYTPAAADHPPPVSQDPRW